MISKSVIKRLTAQLPSIRQARRRWLCTGCDRRYARPRRLRLSGLLIVGECWTCGKDMNRAIFPIEGNAFEGESLVQKMLKRAKMPGPKDWSPRS